LTLDNNGVRDKDFGELINAMSFPDYTYSFLKQLNYSNNEFGPISVKALIDLVEIHSTECKLESFKLNNVKLINGLPTTISLMQHVLLEIPNIKVL
jgi:hypothetical protein